MLTGSRITSTAWSIVIGGLDPDIPILNSSWCRPFFFLVIWNILNLDSSKKGRSRPVWQHLPPTKGYIAPETNASGGVRACGLLARPLRIDTAFIVSRFLAFHRKPG